MANGMNGSSTGGFNLDFPGLSGNLNFAHNFTGNQSPYSMANQQNQPNFASALLPSMPWDSHANTNSLWGSYAPMSSTANIQHYGELVGPQVAGAHAQYLGQCALMNQKQNFLPSMMSSLGGNLSGNGGAAGGGNEISSLLAALAPGEQQARSNLQNQIIGQGGSLSSGSGQSAFSNLENDLAAQRGGAAANATIGLTAPRINQQTQFVNSLLQLFGQMAQ